MVYSAEQWPPRGARFDHGRPRATGTTASAAGGAAEIEKSAARNAVRMIANELAVGLLDHPDACVVIYGHDPDGDTGQQTDAQSSYASTQ